MSKVLVNFIQDRSGSMSSVWSETLSGFRKFVQDLKDDKDSEYLFSLTTFDTSVETPVFEQSIVDVPVDALVAHGPRGATALYDAVGATITNTEASVAKPDKIIVVIVTDGEENSSREWTKEKLQSIIESKLKLGNWTFTYLGTQPETWAAASAIGIAPGATAMYTGTKSHAAYAATSNAVVSLSRSAQMGTCCLVDDYIPDAVATNAGMKKAIKTSEPQPKLQPQTQPKRWR
jgi:hypothetical protein